MASRVELPKELLQSCIQTALASRKRSLATASNPVIKDAIEKEIAALTTANTSITEIK